MKPFLQLLLVLVVAGLGGCTSVKFFRGLPFTGDILYVSGLPPLRQDRVYRCGPACVAAVAAYWDVKLTDFKARWPAPPADTTGPDLRAMAEAVGLRALVYEGSSDDLKENLRQGRPMIVMITQPPNPTLGQVGLIGGLALAVSEHVPHPAHWVIVLGIAADQSVIVHDPAAGSLQLKAPAFEAWWKQQRNLCVLITQG